VPVRERKLSAKYARLSYIADKLNEISYFRATGERGSGKSRYICTTGMLCLRPVLVTSPSAASLFRMMDAFHPTLVIDEFSAVAGSEDTEMLMQILNSGFQRITYIPRCEKGPDGQITVRMFSAFGPKLIGGLKITDSSAFESRCLPVQLRKTARDDITFRMTDRMLGDFADLRAKLYLWRLRNWHTDFEQALDDAERELKNYQIEPRFVQISIPVYGLISDAGLKKDFARMLETRTDDAASDKKESFDGSLISILHRLLFETDEENSTAAWKPFGNAPEPEEGKPLELATIDQITATVNETLPEKKRHDTRWIGRELRKLGFRSREIMRRESARYRKSAVTFERITFAEAFGNYSLPLPPDFDPFNPLTPKNVNDGNSLGWTDQVKNDPSAEASSVQCISLKEKDLTDVSGLNGSKFPEVEAKDFGKPSSAHFEAVPTVVALDTETEPFDEKRGITPRTAKMIGLALCYDGDRADYVTDRESWQMMMPESDLTTVFHNSKFDLLKLRQAGLPLPEKWEDTMIAAHLINENGAHGLKDLSKEHLGIESPVTFDEADRMRLLDPEIFTEYAKNDSRYTFRLWLKFEREIDRQGLRQVYELEKAVVPAVLAMEEAGLKLDLSQMSAMHAETKAECARIKVEVFDHAGCQFDLNSPKKVSTILYEKLGLPCGKETATGQASVDKEALEDIRGYHPAVDAILRYREIDKLASTFLSVLPTFADEQSRIHPEFRPLGATSGRFSCSNPNVQQIPSRSELGKKLRQMFIADEGNVLVVADWSQMELRILAQYSKDPLLLEAYTSGSEADLHTLTAARMFGKTEADVTKPERSIAKMINFGIAYGITPIGLFNRLRPQGVDVTEEQCEQFITGYFRTYAGVKKFLTKVETVVRERGYVKSLLGRRRRVSGQNSREIRQAQNFIIQGTAADLAKSAMVRLHAALPDGARLIAMIHDEFIVECRAEQAEDVRAQMVETMQAAPDGFKIPMVVEAKIAGNWGDAK
ncbi:MAG: DNA polymerase, partial [Blastocatellia bacterium]